jgi:alkaline phosphatase
MSIYQRLTYAVFFIIIASSHLALSPQPLAGAETTYRNVIILVADGMGATHSTIARWYKGKPLSSDRMSVGGIRTCSSDSLITDSAPAATAFATGHKTGDKLIGVLPDKVAIPGVPAVPEESRFKPVATVLEGAKLTGRSVGIVATSNVQHATPAAFTSHWPDRADYNEIAKQQVYLNLDVVLGGGRRYLRTRADGGTRTDGVDLLEVLRSRGYVIAGTRREMMEVKAPRLWGLFAEDAMAYEFDRRILSPEQPSLAEMTRKSIQLLSRNPKGFFLFVEGSKIDWASHANDPIGVISDVLAFDEAVGIAVDFAEKDGRTLVIAVSDHGNGGMSLGSTDSNRIYAKLPWEAVFGPLKKATLTGEGIGTELANTQSETRIRETMTKYYGIDDLKPEEVKEIKEARKSRMNYVVGPMMSTRSYIGWTTNGHTGEDLFMYLYGYKKPIGLIENTEIAHIMARAVGFDLAVVDNRLFLNADQAFGRIGARVKVDRTRGEKQVLVIQKGEKKAELPLSTNIMTIAAPKTKTFTLQGIAVLAPTTEKVYVPEQAVSFFELDNTEKR